MNKVRTIKMLLLGACLMGMLLLFGFKSFTGSNAAAQKKKQETQGASATPATQKQKPEDFVGTETCQTCHETQFNTFAKTTHAKLTHDASWKGKVVGCESCHGAGKAHVEMMAEVIGNGTDPKLVTDKKIVYLASLPSKQVSETCLQCHAGREEHNNYRRGEHWRNDVGCTDCHFAHAPDTAPPRAASHTLISENARPKPDSSTLRMLKANEPQLCMRCHTEQKAQFSMPFRHKVLEGLIKCSDCHNAHGGFELKQTRLANFSASDASCAKCHNDKAGPFNYEHGPVSVEGCSSCHTPHGANNPKLLKRNNVFQLCIECHTNTHAIAGSDEEGGAPGTPSFHNLTQSRYQNCTTCHVMIHGSNSHPFFFR
jgi:predicted CXXCH cytochrome family protein